MSSGSSTPWNKLDLGETVRGLVAGQVIQNRYNLKRLLGRGGMGVVWLAYDEIFKEDVAFKFLPEMLAMDRSAVEDLKREAQLSRRLTHQHIVRVHEFVQDDDQRCVGITMEFVNGDSLSKLKDKQPESIFEVQTLVPWVQQLCQALTYAHEDVQVVHRDLKPANLMIDERGRLKITDFGIARSISDSMARVSQRGMAGTPVYMSPQQAMGEAPCVADDIYSFGATLYDLLTSKPPFYTGDFMLQLREKMPPPIQQRRKELNITGGKVPPHWEKIILACLAKKPSDRPASFRDVMVELKLGVGQKRTKIKKRPRAPTEESVTTSEDIATVEEKTPAGDETVEQREQQRTTSRKTSITPVKHPSKVESKPPSEHKREIVQQTAEPEPSSLSPPAEESKESKFTTPKGTAPSLAPVTPVEQTPPPAPLVKAQVVEKPIETPADKPPTPLPVEDVSAKAGADSIELPSKTIPPEQIQAPNLEATPQGLAPAQFAPTEEPPLQEKTTPAPEAAIELPASPPTPAPLPAEPAPPATTTETPVTEKPVPSQPPAAPALPVQPTEVVPQQPTKRKWIKFALAACCVVLVLGGLALYSPYVVKDVAKFINDLLGKSPGIVKIQTKPPNALINFGNTSSNGPLVKLKEIPAGVYTLEVSAPGYIGLTQEVSVPADHPLPPITVSLEPILANLALQVQPSDANYELLPIRVTTSEMPKPVRGMGSTEINRLCLGQYILKISRAGFGSVMTNIILDGSELSQSVRVSLARLRGRLEFDGVSPVNALLSIEGPLEPCPGDRTIQILRTNLATMQALGELPTGRYAVWFEAPEHEALTNEITVLPDTRTAVGPVVLQRQTGWLSFALLPQTARFRILNSDSKEILAGLGGDNLHSWKLPVGDYQILFEAPGYEPQNREARITYRRTNDIGLISLHKASGTLEFSKFESNPKDATYQILDGDKTIQEGKLTRRIAVPTGQFEVRLLCDGYKTVTAYNVNVSTQAETTLDLVLQRATGTVCFDVSPPSSVCRFQYAPNQSLPGTDEFTNKGSRIEQKLYTGKYLLTITAPYHQQTNLEFAVEPDKLTNLGHIKLSRAIGSVEFSFQPEFAANRSRWEIAMQDSDEPEFVMGVGPTNLSAIKFGQYSMKITSEGFKPISTNFSINAAHSKYTFNLPRAVGLLSVTSTYPAHPKATLTGPIGWPEEKSTNIATPFLMGHLLTGTYEITVAANGFLPAVKRFEIQDDAHVIMADMNLKRETGSLSLLSRPTGAEYILRMVKSSMGDPLLARSEETSLIKTGKTDTVLNKLPTGEYAVEVNYVGTTGVKWKTNGSVAVTTNGAQLVLVLPFGSLEIHTYDEKGLELTNATLFGLPNTPSILNRTPLFLPEIAPCKTNVDVRLHGYRYTNVATEISVAKTNYVKISLTKWNAPQPGDTFWTNQLGMVFTPVDASKKLYFYIWECRCKDFEEFAKSRSFSSEWNRLNSKEYPSNPVRNITWQEAMDYCRWLNDNWRLDDGLVYRLPTDKEWSQAVGLPDEPEPTPFLRGEKVINHFPWGTYWPPPINAGNYPTFLTFDIHEEIAPVGSYQPNALGIYDLGGNVWEWCFDPWRHDSQFRVLRGGSFASIPADELAKLGYSTDRQWRSNFRHTMSENGTAPDVGFRVVIGPPVR